MTDHVPTLLPALPLPEMAERLRQHAHHARGTMAPETGRALRRASAAFQAWAAEQGQPVLPAATELVAGYVNALAAGGRNAAGIRQSVWAIGTVHRMLELPDPTRDAPVRLALKRMARTLGTRPRVGMAQDFVASGADLVGVMQAGRWKSPTMPARYAERLTAKRGAVARFYEGRDRSQT